MATITERAWDGGVDGQEITVELPVTNRLVIQLLSADEENIDCELTIQHDGRSSAEIIVVNGTIVLFTLKGNK